MTDHQPTQPELHDTINALARALDDIFKPYGFALLVFPFDNDASGRMNWSVR
jgi:hypothetical protein